MLNGSRFSGESGFHLTCAQALLTVLLQVLLHGLYLAGGSRAKSSLVVDIDDAGVLNVSSDDRLDNF